MRCSIFWVTQKTKHANQIPMSPPFAQACPCTCAQSNNPCKRKERFKNLREEYTDSYISVCTGAAFMRARIILLILEPDCNVNPCDLRHLSVHWDSYDRAGTGTEALHMLALTAITNNWLCDMDSQSTYL